MAGRRRESCADQRARRAAVDDPAVVLEAAARFLEARSRSVAEVRRRLASAGYRTELVDDAIARLTELGMLDDAAFARAWVESRDRARPRGERALRQELALKGIDRGLADDVLSERRGDPDQASDVDAEAAMRLVARHRRTIDRGRDARARRERAYAILVRNGFDSEVASAEARAAAVTTSDAAGAADAAEDESAEDA
jgi:regulatory protein